METEFWLNQVPLWGIFLLVLVVALSSVWVGMFLGAHEKKQVGHKTGASLGTVIGATLGLLGFLLVFTFNTANNLFELRKQLLLDEVNNIRASYLRAGLLPQPYQNQVRQLIREYVDINVNLIKEDVLQESSEYIEYIAHLYILEKQLWAKVIAMIQVGHAVNGLFIDSLNKMIDLQNTQAILYGYRIPAIIWSALFFITILAMSMVGYQVGLSGEDNPKAGFILALTFATVILLVADLDRAMEGSVRVNQQPMVDLKDRVNL